MAPKTRLTFEPESLPALRLLGLDEDTTFPSLEVLPAQGDMLQLHGPKGSAYFIVLLRIFQTPAPQPQEIELYLRAFPGNPRNILRAVHP